MNRNKQMLLRRKCACDYADDVVTSTSIVEGRVVRTMSKASEHFGQFDPKAFSLQAIHDNGLDDELRSSSPLEVSSLSVLDSMCDKIMSSELLVKPSNPSYNGTPESKVIEENN